MRTTDRRALGVGAAVLAVILLAGLVYWLTRPGDAPVPAAVPDPVPIATPAPPEPAGPCAQGTRRFVPTEISVGGVTRRTHVVAVGREPNGVPGTPAVSDKLGFAWDLGGVEPGQRHGHVLLNTHTWPDGSAMGNKLLDSLQVGGDIRLYGEGRHLCYRVTKRVEVPVADGYPGWDDTDGPPRVVIVVCSGTRLGPGNWTHRTLWFAQPLRGGEPVRPAAATPGRDR